MLFGQKKKKKLAIEHIAKFIEKYGVGEMICQNDDALIEAPDVLAYIADNILKEKEGIIFEED